MTVASKARRITIREVSREAGVSIKTVSSVLNKERHVKGETVFDAVATSRLSQPTLDPPKRIG
jgi:lambda repressor-like predicted transcriptional regulator